MLKVWSEIPPLLRSSVVLSLLRSTGNNPSTFFWFHLLGSLLYAFVISLQNYDFNAWPVVFSTTQWLVYVSVRNTKNFFCQRNSTWIRAFISCQEAQVKQGEIWNTGPFPSSFLHVVGTGPDCWIKFALLNVYSHLIDTERSNQYETSHCFSF